MSKLVTNGVVTNAGYTFHQVLAYGFINGVTGTLLESGNIASVTRLTAGGYIANFAKPLLSANYAVVFGHGANSLGSGSTLDCQLQGSTISGAPTLKTTSGVQFAIATVAPTIANYDNVAISIVVVGRGT